MEHSYIDELSLIDRYVRGTMPLEERAAFEEHFLDCTQCLEALESARSLRAGIRIAAADMAASPATASKGSFGEWLQGLFGWRWAAAVITAALLIVFSPAIVLYQLFDRTRTELAQNQVAFVKELKDARKYFENAQQSPPVVYTLELTRGASEAKRIEIPSSPQWIVFTLATDASQFKTYRATLADSTGKEAWRNDNIQPASPDAVAITVPSTAFMSESYALTLDGVSPAGSASTVSRFDLRVTYKH